MEESRLLSSVFQFSETKKTGSKLPARKNLLKINALVFYPFIFANRQQMR